MNTFYLGLSMAGTVSAGTYTAGVLTELDSWLSAWRDTLHQADTDNTKVFRVKAKIDWGKYKAGDDIELTWDEIPKHNVKIKTLTGASGGGVSAALYCIGLATKNMGLLKDTWMDFSIEDMLNCDDIAAKTAKVYSLLNVLPIEKVIKKLQQITWPDDDALEGKDYLEDIIEIYQTLASYEAIPYPLYKSNSGTNVAVFSTHFDYIRFGFFKHRSKINYDGEMPFRYPLAFREGEKLSNEKNWQRLIESTPATGAFPIGFKSRQVTRMRKEYNGHLFYLNYSVPGSGRDFSLLSPHWVDMMPNQEFEMEYFDGGTFNREPHDLARASLMRYFKSINIELPKNEDGDLMLPNNGKDTFAAVVLIDPFPSQQEKKVPGDDVTDIPTLLQQPLKLVNALMNQGRFHIDWIDKTYDEQYYSRFLIAPKRTPVVHPDTKEDYMLAGAPFSAFAGFLSKSYREHDYQLGHFNTYKFLQDWLTVPTDNTVVNYIKGISDATKEKYIALGWLSKDEKQCQVVPRFVNPEDLNSIEPKWPQMKSADWDKVRKKMLNRGEEVFKHMVDFGKVAEWAAWEFFLDSQLEKVIDKMAEDLRKIKLLK